MKMKISLFITALLLIAVTVNCQNALFYIGQGAYVTVQSGATVDINGDVIIKSNASGSGSLLLDDNVSTDFDVSGDTDVEVYLTFDQWHIISPPISDATINTFLSIYLREFDETIDTNGGGIYYSNNWIYLHAPVSTPMNVMQGYSVWSQTASGNNVYSYTGNLNNASITNNSLTNSGAETGEGWNLAGNPYPCAIDLDASSGWSYTNVDAAVYYWDVSQYRAYSASGLGGTGSGTGSQYVPSNQGFFIKCNNVAGGSIGVNNNVRVHNSASFYKNSKSFDDFLRLKIEGNNDQDELIVHFDSNATVGYDGQFDAYKLYGLLSAPQLYTLTPNVDSIMLTMNVLDIISDTIIIPLCLKVGAQGLYTITASDIGSFDPGVNIYLEDIKTGNITNLMQNQVYSFSASENDDRLRFLLRFGFGTTSIEKTEDEVSFFVYSFDKNIFININELDGSANIKVLDILGRELQSLKADKAGLKKISLHDQPNAIYVLILETKHRVYTEKIYLK